MTTVFGCSNYFPLSCIINFLMPKLIRDCLMSYAFIANLLDTFSIVSDISNTFRSWFSSIRFSISTILLHGPWMPSSFLHPLMLSLFQGIILRFFAASPDCIFYYSYLLGIKCFLITILIIIIINVENYTLWNSLYCVMISSANPTPSNSWN